MNYRIAYLGETMVNWCAGLGTVLANDEVVDGVSVRGGYPVVQQKMKQWCLRVSAYAQRLLDGLDTVDWSDSIKETQRNWIGRSEGTEMKFKTLTPTEDSEDAKEREGEVTVFTTRADTIFGVTFMVLAPESELVAQLTALLVRKPLPTIKNMYRSAPSVSASLTTVSRVCLPDRMLSILSPANASLSG